MFHVEGIESQLDRAKIIGQAKDELLTNIQKMEDVSFRQTALCYAIMPTTVYISNIFYAKKRGLDRQMLIIPKVLFLKLPLR